jgi:Tol biopolymer transport system component/DNA-binding winged helix-turn-helix (wHTH) protein
MMGNKSCIFSFDDVEVREREFLLVKAGKEHAVEPKAFRTLLLLLRNPQKLVTKEELVNAVWGDVAVADGSLTRCVWLLRRLLDDDVNEPRYIATVATVGYKFICKVEAREDGTEGLEATAAPGEGGDLGSVSPNGQNSGTADTADLHRERGRGKKEAVERRKLGSILISGAPLLVVGLAAVWYFSRPLPAPRISLYMKITHDGHAKTLGGTDGSRVYFTQLSPSTIAQVSVTGGDVVNLPVAVPNLSSVENVSADGTTFLIASYEEGNPSRVLWTVPILGGSLHRLSEALSGAFSPDGKAVAYSTLGGDIYVAGSDGSGARNLASIGGKSYHLAWSPDGRTIRFTKDGKLWEISSTGSHVQEVLHGWGGSALQCCGKWTPDGRFFLFLSGTLALPNGILAPAGDQQIWVLDQRRRLFGQQRAEPVQLTAGPIRWGVPFTGKDGASVFADGRTERGELVRFDEKSGQFRPYLGGISAESVAFSSDGKSVAYVSFPEGVLWKANSDGSNPVQLTDPPLHAEGPQWSPDSAQILFIDVSSPFCEMYVVSPNGGSPRRLLPNALHKQDAPSWSSDGRRVVFSRGLSTGQKEENLSVLDIASGKLSLVPGSVGMYFPRWSPDGKFIAAAAFNSQNLKIFDIERQRWSEISTHGSMKGPAWSRDSHSIYFLVLMKDDQAVFRTAIDGGKTERILDLKDLHLAGYQGSSWSLDPTNAPILLRDIGSDDIYALTMERK